MRLSLVRPSGRAIGLVIMLMTAGACTPHESGTDAIVVGETPTISVGRWQGQAIEHHVDFVRYRFVAEGEAATDIEISKRRPEHDRSYGTERLAVQPAPGAVASPELLEAVSAWLQDGAPGMLVEPIPVAADEAAPAPEIPLEAQRVRTLGVGLWLLSGLYLLVAGRRPRERPREHPREHPHEHVDRRELAIAALIAVLVFGVRALLAAPTPIHDDALGDLATGMTCGASPCPSGAAASFGSFMHGTGFPRLLSLLLALGLDMRGIQLVIIAMFSLAFAVVYDAGRRLVPAHGRLVGVLAASSLWVPLFVELISTGEILWSPAVVALPAALVQACLLRGAASGRAEPLVLAGLFAGLSTDAHVAGLILWPALVIVSIAVTRGPASAHARAGPFVWAPVLAAAVAAPMVISPSTARLDAAVLLEHVGWPAAVLASLATLALGLGLRRWLGSGSQARRPALIVALLVPILTCMIALLVAGFVESRPPRYIAPVFPALALAAAWLLGTALARVVAVRVRLGATVLICAVIVSATLPAYARRMAVDRDRWSYADVAALGEFARAHGISEATVHLSLRGGLCGHQLFGDRGQRLDELLIGALRMLGRLDPTSQLAASRSLPSYFVSKQRRDALCVGLDAASCPAGRWALPADAITLPSGPGHTIVLIPHRPLADLAGMRVCVRSDHDGGCGPTTPEPLRAELRRILPRHASAAAPELGPVTAVYYELPLHGPIDTAAPVHATLQLVGQPTPWRFVGVEGAASYEQTLPATTLELRMDPGAAATVTIATDAPSEALGHLWWPPVIELPEGVAPLAEP